MRSTRHRPHPSPLAMSKLSNGLSFSSNPGFYKLPVADVSQSNLRLTPLTTRHYSVYTAPVDDSHNNDCGNGLNNSAYSLSDYSTSGFEVVPTGYSNNNYNNSNSSGGLPSGEMYASPNQPLHNSIYQSLIPTLASDQRQSERRPSHRSRTSRQPSKLLSSASSLRSTVSTIFSLRSSNQTQKKPRVQLLDFPLELLDDILGNLDQASLLNLVTVSKFVSSLVIRHLYFEPQFVSTYRLAQFVTTVSTNEEVASYVKILDLSSIPVNLLKPGTDQPLAGWRDWKLRSEPLYSVNSSTHSLQTFHSMSGRVISPLESIKPKPPRQRSKSEVVAPTRGQLVAPSKKRSVLLRYSKFASSFGSSKHTALGNSDSSVDCAQPKLSRKRRRALSLTSYGSSRTGEGLKPIKSHVGDMNHPTLLLQQQQQELQRNKFLATHPTQSVLLRQYANSKDIPVGALLHILACCQNIIIADLSNVQLADDYYVTEAKLYPAKANSGMIFVSDVARLHFWPDEHIRTATPETVVTSVAALRMLRTVNIKNVTWLTKGQVARMLESVVSVEGEGVECDFRGSGLARGLEWAVKGSVEELRKQIEVN